MSHRTGDPALSTRSASGLVARLVALALVLGLGLPALALASPATAAAPGMPLSGKVGTSNGTGVAGVVVTVHDIDRDDALVATATTNGDGVYGVADLDPGDYYVVATPAADDPQLLATASDQVVVRGGDEVVDLVLRVSNVRGVVSRSDGSAAAGATVEVDADGYHRATAYPDGSFRLALPEGEWRLGAIPSSENPALDVPQSRSLDVASSGVTAADIALSQPNLRGTVLAPDGSTAMAGATVRVLTAGGYWVMGLVMASRSDGSFGFRLPAGSYRFQVKPPATNPTGWVGYVGDQFEVTEADTPSAPRIQDLPLHGPTLTGVVRTPGGAPVPRAYIDVYDSEGESFHARSDASGRYGVDIAAGRVNVYLAAPTPSASYLDRNFTLDVPELPFERDLVFSEPNVTGRVVTADGLPVGNAELDVFGPDTLPDGVRWGETDRQGRFGLRLDPGTTQRIVADPPASFPDGIGTGMRVEVPADGSLDGVEMVLDRPATPPYDIVPLDMSVNERPVVRQGAPVISADGTVVAVQAHTDLGCDCEERQSDLPSAPSTDPAGTFVGVVLRDRVTGDDEPLVAPGGTIISPSGEMALDAHGDLVAFVTSQDDLIEGDEPYSEDVFVLDRTTDTLYPLARPIADPESPYEAPTYQYRGVAMSADGRRLVLLQEGRDLEGEWRTEVVIVDLDTSGEEVARQTVEATGISLPMPSISRDGSTVAWTDFESGHWRLHVLDVDSGEEDPVRTFSPGADRFDDPEDRPSLSDDGRFVAYPSLVDRPEGDDHDRVSVVRLVDRDSGTDRRVELFGADGGPGGSGVRRLALSGDGTGLVVLTRGPNPEDSEDQAWKVDLTTDEAEMITRTSTGRPSSEGAYDIATPADLSLMALQTSSEELSGTTEAFVVLALGEVVAPEWPEGASLSAAPGDIGTTSVRLQWTEATDNVAVTGYRVYRGEQLVGTTSAATRQFRVTGLQADTAYTFTVQAIDGRGTLSTDGPSASVRTLREDSTELRPLATTPRPGGADLSWDTPSGADAVLLRTYLGDVQVDERTLGGAATEAQQRGLAAGTAYTFQVFTRTGETVRPFTQRATVTTPALTFSSLTWTVPIVQGDIARRGSSATITATAEPGREVSVAVEHLSWYDDEHELLDTPRTVTSVVPLAEVAGTPGSYRGGFELVDGVAKILGMVGTVYDGHGGELDRTSTRAPVRVSGDVVITVDAPVGSLPGGYLQMASEDAGQAVSRAVSGGTVVTLGHLTSATDYTVEILDGRGRVAARRADVDVRDGLATAFTLDPRLAAVLDVLVRTPDGDEVAGATAELTDADTGEYLAGERTYDGSFWFDGLEEDQRVVLRLRYPAPRDLLRPAPRTVTLTAGVNQLDVVADRLPRATLTGVVRADDGSIPVGAVVSLSQHHEGEGRQSRSTVGADGRYEISGLRGPGQLAVRSGIMRSEADVDLTAGPATQDLLLTGPRPYTARLRLFVRPAGAQTETGPIPIDWRTAVHYGMTLWVDGVWQGLGTNPIAEDGSTLVPVTAAPGQEVRWCVTGYEARVEATCVSTTLTGDRTPTLEMHAGPGVDVTMDIVDAEGRDVVDSTVDVYQVLDTYRKHVRNISRAAHHVTSRVPGVGTYVVEAWKGNLSVERTFTITPTDAQVDLGELVLRRTTHFSGPENAVTAGRSEVLPGGDIEMRAAWRNSGSDLSAVTARIEVPSGTTLVPDSVIVDGQTAPTTSGPGHVDVEIGALPEGAAGTLRYRLRAGAEPTGSLAGRVGLRYPGDGGTVTEPLAPVTVPVAAVTITGPTTPTELRIPLNGRAPVGRTVTITDGGVPVGQAVAGPGGVWRANVELAEQPRTQVEHRIVAEIDVDGERFFAEHVVHVDQTRPAVTSVSLYQMDGAFQNGRRITFDPLDGVARFPFVFVPGQDTVVEVSFDEPSLVSRADVLIGAQRFAATRRADGVFVARTRASSLSGPIRLDYDAIAKPIDLTVAEQSDREIRDGAPASLTGFEISDVAQPDTSGSGARSGGFTMSLPSAGGSVRSTMTVTREEYAPTDADLAMQRATGSPAWGVTSTRSGNTLSFSMLVPLSEIPGLAARAEDEGTPMGRALADALRNAVGPSSIEPAARAGVAVGVARVGYQLAFNGATTLDSLLSAFGAGDKYQNLAKAIDAAGGCSPAAAAAYAERAQNIALAAAAGDIGGAIFNVGALVLGPASFGLGTVALGVLGWAMDKAIGYAVDKATENLMNDIKADDECEDEEEDEDDDEKDDEPLADPVWIYDPSGYVYEGARSVRIGVVTATLLTAPTADGPWTMWDAEWFGQTNPQTTDNDGRYGWDVPEGWWKVAFTKDGYRTAHSRVLRVLPPHLDVDVSMVKDGYPHVTGAVLRSGLLELTFDRLVRSGTTQRADALTVVDANGVEVPGTWSAVGSASGDGDVALQRGLRFVPATTPPAGTRLTVTVDSIADYGGRMMAEPFTGTVTVPGSQGPGDPPPPESEAPDAPTEVTATGGERRAAVDWTAPSDNGSAILDYVVTVLPSGRQLIVDADETGVDVDSLLPGTPYTFTVTARNAVGTGPVSDPSNEVVPTAVAPETRLTAGPTQSGFVLSRSATLAWSSESEGVTFVCELDGRPRACDSTRLTLAGLGAGTHQFTVAARDADGDVDATPATRTWTVPRDDRALSGGAAWKRRGDPRAFLGTVTQTTDRRATLTEQVDGVRRLALVASRGRGHGTVAVYLGAKRLGSYDLSARSLRHRQVIPVASFASPRSGIVRIVVTSRRETVRIDGLGVATR